MALDLGIEGFDELEEIGRGGFGIVYKARQMALRRVVAIKVLGGVLDDQTRSRFEREGRAVGALSKDPYIVTVYSTGFTADDRPYIVMEYLPGGTLSARLADGTSPMGWREPFEVGAKLADALGFARRAGILHRDVKPANVLFSRRGEPKLSDFGIARLKGVTETANGVVTTTVAHVAPEVLAGKRPREASYVYSLGSTIYTLIAGSPAFVHDTGESVLPVYARIATEAVPDLRSRTSLTRRVSCSKTRCERTPKNASAPPPSSPSGCARCSTPVRRPETFPGPAASGGLGESSLGLGRRGIARAVGRPSSSFRTRGTR